MKLVVVEEEHAPDIIDVLHGDQYIIVDHKLWNNLEVGDMVQVMNNSWGTTVYWVVDVHDQEPHGTQFVAMVEPRL